MTPLAQIDRWLSERFAGVLSTATGVEATPDSVFQIGSITKPLTATLVLQLVDEGRVELDAPVRRYLPGFRVADEAASAAITVRHLLAHTAGFGGDVFTDTGRNDDAIELYVAALAEVEQDFAPGTMFSYNNAAYIVLGRLDDPPAHVHDGYTGTDLANGGDGVDRCRIDVNAYNPDQHDLNYSCETIETVQLT